ncbi:MAG: tetratricopeptide repeat protein [Phenylobacterium sp.]|uniref:tetratricopeptide repeat protein n=1 Tax=Phenylobacterium sp. TaxID=1871053 RepID=UPI00180DC085|nr:tetratricopeptide repeat protein [Phenylobacterium sp.]MBA4792313.1 tetratricopeptide repeat protein [Phenylobacterium sp.]
MQIRDHQGLELSGASRFSADAYRQAVHAYHCYAGEPFAPLEAALADSPDFVMAHVLKAYMTLLGGSAATAVIGSEAFAAAKDLPATRREQGHLAAIGSLLAGEIRAAGRILEDVSLEFPRDVLALQAGQLMDFLVGDSRNLRDRIGRALPAWSEGMPDHHAVLGMHAFGLEETALYDRAEAAGRRAVELEPRNNWAQHAVAHVLEMQDRRADGIAWMRTENAAWAPESMLAVHNWWHLALFHLGLGDVDSVLALYDGPIYGTPSDMTFDMVDAAALLWRLKLMGVEAGDRWARLAEVYAGTSRGQYAFDDAHAMMAFVGAGRADDAKAVLEAQAAAAAGPGDNALFAAEVGRPVCEALFAFGQGDYARASDLLRGVRHRLQRFGGSHAQRDVFDLTLIEAARRGGDQSLERALRAERAAANPLAPGRGVVLAA